MISGPRRLQTRNRVPDTGRPSDGTQGPLEIVKSAVDEAGKLTPIIDGSYPLKETVDAMCYIDRGHVGGKVATSI